jgi:hypothetical protein
VFKPNRGQTVSGDHMSLSDDRFFMYRGDASRCGRRLVSTGAGGARCSGSRWTNAWTDQPQHSFYCGEESDGGLPAGASCDALDDVVSRPASVAAAPEAGFDVLQLPACLGVGCYLPATVGRLWRQAETWGHPAQKSTSVSVRVKGPASSSLGLRNGPLEVQATVDTQTAARLSP